MQRLPETERLYLRELVPSDADMIFRLNSDPDVMRYMPEHARAAVSADSSRQFVESFIRYYAEKPGLGLWPTVLKAGGRCIGWTCLKDLADTDEVEIGYRYFPQFWGQGFCTEISSALLEYGFRQLGLPRIVAISHPDNRASRRVLEKLGLRYERDAHYYGIDVVYYALDREDLDNHGTQPDARTSRR